MLCRVVIRPSDIEEEARISPGHPYLKEMMK